MIPFYPNVAPDSLPGRLLLDVEAFLLDPGLEGLRERGFLVACSGGSDSCALLRACAHVASASGFRLEAATVDHGIRPASAADADFVESLCARLEIPCHRIRLEMPLDAGENALRDARYAFFDECIRSRALGGLLLGHTAEDQAETVLLHLIRGTGLRGLGAMRAVEGNRLRPFLERRKEELQAFLRALGETWREDESNFQEAYLRNRVRRRLIPWMQEENPRIVEGLCRLARAARLEHDAVVELAQRRLEGRLQVFTGRVEALPLKDWLVDPPGIRRITLRRWWRHLAPEGTELPAVRVEEACRALEAGGTGTWDFPGPVRLTADRGFLVMASPPAGLGQFSVTFSGPHDSAEKAAGTAGAFRLVPDASGEIAVLADSFPLTLRSPAPGDRLWRKGAPPMRCKKLLERLPRGLRPHALVLADSRGFVRWQLFVPAVPGPEPFLRFSLEWNGQRVPVLFSGASFP